MEFINSSAHWYKHFTGNTAPQGRCPRADISFTCGDHCQTDTDCSNNRKCCDHGCGKSCRHTVTGRDL